MQQYEQLQEDEVQSLKRERMERRQRKEREIYLMGRCVHYTIISWIVISIGALLYYLSIDKSFNYAQIIDSCQDLQTLKNVNDQIFPLLDELTYKKFFRIFRVNLENECPFWVGDFICTSKKCHVCTCNTSELPDHWLQPQSQKINQPALDFAFWEAERYQRKQISKIDPSDWIWHVEDQANDHGVYVDLKLNPEAYTGYQGQHIWHAIYHENCFQGENICKEERALNKLISGLHTSISSQLSEFYVDLDTNRTFPHYSVYFKKVDDERIKNLFFLYSVLLRVVILAGPGISNYDINSLSFEDDLRSKQLLSQILDIAGSQCSKPFDEETFFREIKFDTKKQYQRYIHNISMIMDCVECEKCKVFGKMQTYGLGTAFKILFSENPSMFSGQLKRNELVALINTFGKVSSSVRSVELMYQRRVDFFWNLFVTLFSTGLTLCIFLKMIHQIYIAMDAKIKRMFSNMPNPAGSNKKQKRD